MYIQITTKCNMSCEHCGMNCTNEGENMSKETLLKALDMGHGQLAIGGGEPTIHPQFNDFLITILSHEYTEYTWMITNGSKTNLSIALAKMSNENFCVALSQDCFHDEIDERVVNTFNDLNLEIRDNTENLINAGRCDWVDNDGCICPNMIIKPNGDIYGCGCDNAPMIGNVDNGIFEQYEEWQHGECSEYNLEQMQETC